jgi:uncharacterized protein
MHSPTNFLKILLLLLTLAAAVAIYCWQIEPNMLSIKHVEIKSPLLAKDCTVFFMTDLHVPLSKTMEIALYNSLEKQKPDIILIGGDFSRYKTRASFAREKLAAIANFGTTIMVLGNSDQCGSRQCVYCFLKYTVDRLYQQPFSILRNKMQSFPEYNINVFGLDDPVTLKDDPGSIESVPDSQFNILLLHSVYRLTALQKERFGLICSGHTHGGQVFFLRPFIHLFDPAIDKRYIKGLFHLKKGMMIVSSGIGNSFLPIRLGVVPEVVVISLKKGNE